MDFVSIVTTELPHQSNVMLLYERAKKMMMVAKATPVSRPADRRSVGRIVSFKSERGAVE